MSKKKSAVKVTQVKQTAAKKTAPKTVVPKKMKYLSAAKKTALKTDLKQPKAAKIQLQDKATADNPKGGSSPVADKTPLIKPQLKIAYDESMTIDWQGDLMGNGAQMLHQLSHYVTLMEHYQQQGKRLAVIVY